MKIKFIATAARWRDRVNGNTYHSVRIQRVRDGKVIACGIQYGYGDQYRYTALKAMSAARWIPPKYRGQEANGFPKAAQYERENGYPIAWSVSDGLKRDCVANGEA